MDIVRYLLPFANMPAKPEVVKVSSSGTGYIEVYVKNAGTATLGRGFLEGKAIFPDGTVGAFHVSSGIELEPGETTKLLTYASTQRVIQDLKFLEIGGDTFPIEMQLKRGFFGWSVR